MELSNKQKEIVNASENKVIVIASAAAGKTATLTARLRYLLDSGVDPKELVAITFTNLAAEELRERVGEKAKDCFIGTVHSYCNYLLTASGVDTKNLLNDEKFDELFELIKKHPECVKKVDHLLLDEAQDSNEAQFEFFLDTVKPKHYMLVGDARQSIYRFAGALPQALIDLSKNSDVKVYDLNENYRNGSDILNYAKTIIRQNGYDYIDTSIPMRQNKGRVVTVEYSPSAIAKTVKKMGDFKDWFILCRWNADIPYISSALEREKVPYAVIRKRDFSSNQELRDKMAEDTVKVMTIHQSKGLEAKNVVVIGTNFGRRSMDEAEENLCVNYVAATRARDLLVWTYKPKARPKKNGYVSWE